MKKQLLTLLSAVLVSISIWAEDAPPPDSGDGKPIQNQPAFDLPGAGSVGAGGAYAFGYPMPGAPGRSGLSGKTGLSYNSAHLSDSSLAGYGWNVPMQAVRRSSRFGVDQLYTTNSFFSAPGAGELVLVNDSTSVKEYRARIEGGFVRWFYDTSSSYWYSYDQNGVKTTYGMLNTSRMVDTNNAAHIYEWYVDKIEDVYGNYIKFNYWKDEGTVYPKEIVYTGHGTTDGLNSIRFQPFYKGPVLHSYYMRPDITTSYASGFKTTQRFRLEAVESYTESQLVSRYELGYSPGSTGVRSLLSSVTRIGTDGTNAMPASAFEYHQPDIGAARQNLTNFFLPEGLHLVMFQPGSTNEVPGDGGVRFADINGDSLPDLLYASGCVTNGTSRGIWLNTGVGWAEATNWSFPTNNIWFVDYVDADDQTPDSTGTVLMDINGDGKADILTAQLYLNKNQNPVERRHAWINTGSGWEEKAQWNIPTNIALLGSFSSNGTEQVLIEMNVQFPDLNGDGLPDLVYSVTNQTAATSLSGGHLPMTNAVWLNTGSGWKSTSQWTLPSGHKLLAGLQNDGSAAPRDGSLRFVDLNGDGLSDLLYANGHKWGYEGATNDAAGRAKKAWLNTGSGWVQDERWNLPEYNAPYHNQDFDFNWFQTDHPYYYFSSASMSAPFPVGLRMQDVNGDGLPDLVLCQLYDYASFASASNRNDVCTNYCAESGCNNTDIYGGSSTQACEECVYTGLTNCLFNIQACIAAGNSSNDCAAARQACVEAVTHNEQEYAACLLRQTLCLEERAARSNLAVEAYNECINYRANSGGCYTDCMDLYLQLEDELIYTAVWLNTGNGWSRNDSYLPAPEKRVHFVGVYTNGPVKTVLDTRMNLLDLNGDGTPEYIADSAEPIAGLENPRMIFSGVDGREVLSVRHNPYGGTETIAYKGAAQTEHFESPANFRVVDHVTVDDGFGKAYRTQYDYSGGWFFVDDSGKRRNQFRGFNRRSAVNAAGVKTVAYYHQGGGADGSAHGENSDSEVKSGRTYRLEIYGTNGILYASTVTRWDEASYQDGSTPRYWAKKAQETSFSFTESGAYRSTAVKSFYDDSTGLTTSMQALGEVTADPETGTVTDLTVGSDEVYTFMAYETFSGTPGAYIKGRPSSIRVCSDSAGAVQLGLKTSTYFANGTLQTQNRWLNTTGQMVKEMEILSYDDYGNPQQTENAAGLVTTFDFDTVHHAYPVKTSSAGQETFMTTDYRSGKNLTVTDQAGVVSSNAYDVFFRPVKTWKDGIWREAYDYHVGPSGGSEPQNVYTYNWVPGYWSEGWQQTNSSTFVASNVWVEGFWQAELKTVIPGEDYILDNHIYVRINNGDSIPGDAEKILYANGLGRTIQTRVESERDDGAWRVQNTVYDDEGRITYAYEPRFESGSQYTPFNPKNPAVKYDYDALGRVCKTTPRTGDSGSPTAPSVTLYEEGNNPWAVVATDALGIVHKTYKDAHGRVIKVKDFPDGLGGSAVETRYEFDLLGRLVKTIDPKNNQIVVAYDSLGRKTQMNDPDMGVWHYAYDNAGRLTNQLDAASNHITFAYDTLNRVQTQRVYNASGALEDTVVHTYDSSDNAGFTVYKGQLYRTVQNGVTNRYSYDDHDNILKVEAALAGIGTFTTTNTYDEMDRPLSIGYPNGEAAVQYTFGSIGNLKGVSSLYGAGDDGMDFYNVGAFNELGQIENVTYGNGLESRFSYYSSSRRLRQSATRQINGKAYQQLSYTYNAGGLITAIKDNLRTGEQSSTYDSIQYDGLNRLKSLSYGGQASPVTYGYDALGNIVNNGEYTNQTYQYSGTAPHAVTAIGDETFAYDSNGNITNALGRELTFDAYNRLVKVKMDGGTEVRFRYLASGARYLKETVTAGQTNRTIYVGQAYEENRYATGHTNKLCHVFFAGKRIASFAPIPAGEQVASALPISDLRLANGETLAAVGNHQSKIANSWERTYARNGVFVRYVARLAPKTLVDRLTPVVALIAVVLFFACLLQRDRRPLRFKVKGVVGYRRGKAAGLRPEALGSKRFAFISTIRGSLLSLRSPRSFAAIFQVSNFRFQVSCKQALCVLFALTFFFQPCYAQGSYQRGDVNGDGVVDIGDALLIQQVVDGKRKQDSTVFRAGFANGDVNYDGAVNATDARIIMEYATGLRTSLPAAPGGEREQTFVYYHADHLGSSNIVTDRHGEIVQQIEYTPYGEIRHETNLGVSVNRLYTGQELDRETGLYYYNARYYDSRIGRFISPDTLIPDASNSQQFNRYSYVLNNPVMFNDPSGNEVNYADPHLVFEDGMDEEEWEANRQARADARDAERDAERQAREQQYAQDALREAIDELGIDAVIDLLYDQGAFGSLPLDDVKSQYENLESALEQLKDAGKDINPELAALLAVLAIGKESLGDAEEFNRLSEQAAAQIGKVAANIDAINQNLQKELENHSILKGAGEGAIKGYYAWVDGANPFGNFCAANYLDSKGSAGIYAMSSILGVGSRMMIEAAIFRNVSIGIGLDFSKASLFEKGALALVGGDKAVLTMLLTDGLPFSIRSAISLYNVGSKIEGAQSLYQSSQSLRGNQ